MDEYPIRLVRWIDSASFNSWTSLNEVKEMRPDPVVSVGFVVADDDTRLVLMLSVTERDYPLALQNADGALVIPRVAIIEETPIRRPY